MRMRDCSVATASQWKSLANSAASTKNSPAELVPKTSDRPSNVRLSSRSRPFDEINGLDFVDCLKRYSFRPSDRLSSFVSSRESIFIQLAIGLADQERAAADTTARVAFAPSASPFSKSP